jgi:hypothetical protein
MDVYNRQHPGMSKNATRKEKKKNGIKARNVAAAAFFCFFCIAFVIIIIEIDLLPFFQQLEI